MTLFETVALWIALVTGVVGAITSVVQVIIQWYTLREVGDLDQDRKDWFEKEPWRHYRKE